MSREQIALTVALLAAGFVLCLAGHYAGYFILGFAASVLHRNNKNGPPPAL